MKVAIGNDPPGLEHKLHLVDTLKSKGFEVVDLGCHSAEPADYPDFAKIVGEGVAKGEYERGILICGTGQGMNIAANKVKGVRAALCFDVLPAIMSRDHNDSNVLCMGGWLITKERAEIISLSWLGGRFSGGVHSNRLEKIKSIENGN
ncbi:MAG: ribose 5-phosphate isomerase B [Chloroflexi bacterium]|jgi:ribose 5-phosphate isomerase B|nr:ribose 5-phosphate isomerase B [Chloroflexota bacterium]MBT5337061.1 ribose 5-phosphate isomerase B [Chloroflexota bacterium]MBT6988055.1 ribose 5-phosphate isomerase B [Chloroflexota bacterium]